MTAINSFIASFRLNYGAIWNERCDGLENYLQRMNANAKENNHS